MRCSHWLPVHCLMNSRSASENKRRGSLSNGLSGLRMGQHATNTAIATTTTTIAATHSHTVGMPGIRHVGHCHPDNGLRLMSAAYSGLSVSANNRSCTRMHTPPTYPMVPMPPEPATAHRAWRAHRCAPISLRANRIGCHMGQHHPNTAHTTATGMMSQNTAPIHNPHLSRDDCDRNRSRSRLRCSLSIPYPHLPWSGPLTSHRLCAHRRAP